MNKKTIVLADNSYTIRRIVELSFSEEESIELISFEDGSNLRRKLVELKPEIVLVDIKLPEFSGYEVCKFINTTESLSHTKVFLLKGGFEPIDESLLTNLKYASIITKPFDSNALVATIKKMLAAPARRTPATVPEETPSFIPGDLPDIDNFSEAESDIDFSDMGEERAPGNLLRAGAGQKTVQYLPSDDVLPSEEITQGTQPDFDSLAPSSADDMENPFQDESPISPARQKTLAEEEMDIKENIRMQERELDIESVTQEELRLKKHLEGREELFSGAGADLDAAMEPGKPGLFDDDKWGSLPPGLDTGIEMPGSDEEQELSGRGIDDFQTGTPGEIAAADDNLQIDDLMGAKPTGKPGKPGADRFPGIDDVFDREEINFEKEIKSQPIPLDDIASPAVKPGFLKAKPKQGIQAPPPFASEPGKKIPT
ncbi:MAG: response regulator, partial [Candidatus Aminicenantes bacterium]|nr:response regulator [Candidatus Aminicenantes bacterium]